MLRTTKQLAVPQSRVKTTLRMEVTEIDDTQYFLEAVDGPYLHRARVVAHELPLPTDEISSVEVGDEFEVRVT